MAKKKNLTTQLQLPHTAAGPYLGFSLQAGRMLELLLDAGVNEVVSLEHFDDLGVESTIGGDKKAIQTKNAAKGNPVSNRSNEFWKTFKNWAHAVSTGILPANKTKFEMYTFSVKAGEICDLFSQAQSIDEAKAACIKAKELLKIDGKKLPVNAQAVLQLQDDLLLPIIVAFRFDCGTGDKKAEMIKKLSNRAIPPEMVETVMTHLVGWIKVRTDAQLQAGEVARISAKEFHQEMVTITRKLDSQFLLSGMPISVPHSSSEHETKNFVQQLRLIESGEELILRAISSYLRSKAYRSAWSERMIVHESSFDEYEDGITANWQTAKVAHGVLHGNRSEVDRGKLLFVDCIRFAPMLQGRPVPTEFAEGCHHELAEELIIGWHPRFGELLGGHTQQGN